MAKLGGFKQYRLPVSGLMDTRSMVDALPAGYNRLNKNISAYSVRQVCRMPGWIKFGNDTPSDNSDLHDQLVGKVLGYESYQYTTPGGTFVAGYEYENFFPSQSSSNDPVFSTSGPYCGDAREESTGFVNPVVSSGSGPYISEWFLGYPFFHPGGFSDVHQSSVYEITDLPYASDPASVCNTGYPDYYVEPYFYFTNATWVPPTITAGYGYGDWTTFYTTIDEGVYEYCGDVLGYRSYCADSFSSRQGREPITLLHELKSASGSRVLIAGTQSRLYAFSDRSNSWRIIADGKGGVDTCGCGERRFEMASLGKYAVFTNNRDPVMAWAIDTPTSGCDLQAAQPIDDLDEIGLTKAGVVVEYKGFIFLFDLDISGVRYPGKAVWSDYGDARSYVPANDSLSGDSDVGDVGERVLGAAVLGDYLFIYKERSIWRCTLVGGEETFVFQQVYHGEETPRYRHTIISTGDVHYYFGKDSIYAFDLFGQRPTKVDWMHLASGLIFDGNAVIGKDNLVGGIEESACDLAVAGWDPQNKELWFSWVAKKNSDGTSVSETTQTSFSPTHSADCTNRSMVFNMQYQLSSYVDHGFSAFGNYRPDIRPTLREWLVELGVCDEGELDVDIKTGTPYYDPALTPGDPVDYIWNEDEDPDLPQGPNGLCAALGDSSFDDICQGCDVATKFLMASSADYCIKEYSIDNYSRRHFVWSTNTYTSIGYTTLVESGAMDFGTDSEKYINRLTVEFKAPDQTPTPSLYASFGFASQPECEFWDDLNPQPLECQTNSSGALRPIDKAYFNRLTRGRYLFYRYWLTGTTAATCFSKVEATVRKAEA